MKKFLLLFLLLATSALASIEDIYVEIRANKLTDSFFRAKYDSDTNKLYIGATSLFYFLEIYDINVDLENKKVSFMADDREISNTIPNNDCFIMDDELFIDKNAYIKDLHFKKIIFNYNYLRLDVIPNFTLPIEERTQGKLARLRLENSEFEENGIKKITMPRKFIDSGFLKLNYLPKDKYFSYYYGTQFLYGSLYLSGNKYKKLSYKTLTYDIGDKELTFGNIGLSELGGDNISGVSYTTKNDYLYRNGSEVIIRGEVKDADIVELYDGGALVDYLYPKNNKFKFVVKNMSDKYTVKIYHNNGSIEKRYIYNLFDLNMLKKGKTRFDFEVGKNHQKENGFTTDFYYGLNNNLTLWGGIDKINEKNIKKYGFLFNSHEKTFPTLIDFKYYKKDDYKLDIHQKFKEYNLHYLRYDKYERISLNHDFEYNYLDIGREKFYNMPTNFISWSNSYFSPINVSLHMSSNRENYKITPTFSYYGYLSTIFKIELIKDRNNQKWKEYYDLKLNKYSVPVYDKIYLDLGAFVRYNRQERDFIFGFNFNLRFDDGIYIQSNFDMTREHGKNNYMRNMELSKIIDIANPITNLENDNSVTNSEIYGRIFLDNNCNGKYDKEDEVVKDAKILASSNKAVSNNKGEYNIGGIYQDIILQVDRTTIDPMYKPLFEKLKIKTRSSARYKLDIPLQPISLVSGYVCGEARLMGRIGVQLIKNGKIIKEIKPEFDGMYVFQEVVPGKYTINFVYYGKGDKKFSRQNIKLNIPINSVGEYYEGYDTVIGECDEKE